MRHLKIVHVIMVFGTALFAGLLYAFEQGVVPAMQPMDGPSYVALQQRLIRALDHGPTGVIAVATLSMLLPLYPLIRLWKFRRTAYWRWTFIGWVLFCFGVSIFTIALNVPINMAFVAMDAARPAANWSALRDQWNALNCIRTPLNYLSLLAYLIASLKPFPGTTEDCSSR